VRVDKAVPYPIESVDNALRLILLLNEEREVGVTSAAQYLGVAPSTAHRLLSMLVHYGFAEKNANRRYVPSWTSPAPVTPKSPLATLRAVVGPHLETLSRTLEETVHLVILRGTAAHFLAGVEFPGSLVASRAGMTMPAHCTAGGKAILACLRPADLAALFPHGLPVVYGPGPTELSVLQRQLAGVRRAGYSVNGEESERGIVGVAVPLRDPNGQVHGALAVGMPSARCPHERVPIVARALQAEAAEAVTALEGVATRPTYSSSARLA
jgi:IclR family acetate operon transcriptional repressor